MPSPAEPPLGPPLDPQRDADQQERISVGLIAYLSRHALDEDYGWVTRHQPGLGGRGARVAAVVTLAAFALLALTAASQTTRSSVTVARERDQLIGQITARRAAVDRKLDTARDVAADNQRLAQTYAAGTGANSTTLAAVRRLQLLTGELAVRGRGVKVVVDDAPNADTDRERVLDKDLQRLVNALWESGAEAISVNGQRLTSLSAIRQAGGAINVNFVPLQPPYTVLVIGDPDRIPARFAASTGGAAWFDLQRQVGLRLRLQSEASLSLPASGQLTLRYAERLRRGAR